MTNSTSCCKARIAPYDLRQAMSRNLRDCSKTQSAISFMAGMIVLLGATFLGFGSRDRTIRAERSDVVTYAGLSFNIEDRVSLARLSELIEQRNAGTNVRVIRLETDPSIASSVIMNTFIAVTNSGIMHLEVVDLKTEKTAQLYAVGDEKLVPFNTVPLATSLKSIWVDPLTGNSFASLKLDPKSGASLSGGFSYPIPEKVLEDIRRHYLTIYVTEQTASGVLIDGVARLQSLSAPAILVTWAPIEDE